MKTYLILTTMMLIHELGHVIVAYLLKYEINEIRIYPFGLCANILESNHGKSWHEIIIILSGIGIHLCYPFIFMLAYHYNLISQGYMQTLNELNHSILIFNLMPVYPLDGGKLINAFLNYFFSYACSKIITFVLSIFTIIYLLSHIQLNMILVYSFVMMQFIKNVLYNTEDILAFYYYRFQNPLEHSKYHIKKQIYRNKAVILNKHNKYINEKNWLKNIFGLKKTDIYR